MAKKVVIQKRRALKKATSPFVTKFKLDAFMTGVKQTTVTIENGVITNIDIPAHHLRENAFEKRDSAMRQAKILFAKYLHNTPGVVVSKPS